MPKTVLVADDSLTIRKVVGMLFATEDFQLTLVDNGLDAISRAREMKPDVVLADCMMPGKSGYEVCEALKHDPSTAHIPVMLLAGTFEPFDPARAQAVGAAGHIVKPFDSTQFLDKVKSLAGMPTGSAMPQTIGPVSTSTPAAPVTTPAARPAVGAPLQGIQQPRPMPGMAGIPPGAPTGPRPGIPMGTQPGGMPPRPMGMPPGPGMPGMPPRPMGGIPMGTQPGMPRPGMPPGPGMPAPGMPPGPGGMPPRPMGVPGMPGTMPGMARPGMPPGMPPGAPGMPPPGGAFPRPPPSGAAPLPGQGVPPRRDPFGLGGAPAPGMPGRPAPQPPPPAHHESLSLDDGGEGQLREALSKASREVIEKIAWEVVPQLAETIIREELDRLIKEREAKGLA